MATAIGKRKRELTSRSHRPSKKAAPDVISNGKKNASSQAKGNQKAASHLSVFTEAGTNGVTTSAIAQQQPLHIQVVTGSYERVLHGISARIPRSALNRKPQTETAPNGDEETEAANLKNSTAASDLDNVTFSDSFLFAAHASAIRCLAISPPTEEADKCFLATGSSDERINVYSLSTAPPPVSAYNSNAKPNLPLLTGTATAENPRNRSLGSLIHHDRAITRLQFPTKTKLFSGAEDATIAISRTRDWTVLSSIKTPIPKAQGRPSGDTAGPGEIPAGVNDFAIHPSQKLMLSVGRGEKCMRLWNLMTGKKAGVLNFDRGLLAQAGETKFSSGEGRSVLWDEEGHNYVVGFERGAALFGIDSEPKAIIRPSPSTKVHQMKWLRLPTSLGNVLAMCTEDGRICFYSTDGIGHKEDGKLPLVPCVAELGGRAAGLTGRIKAFEILKMPADNVEDIDIEWIVVTGSSDGAIRLWSLGGSEISLAKGQKTPRQVGKLFATQETGDRITCLGAFVLDGKVDDSPEESFEVLEIEDGKSEESEDSDE